MSPSRLDLLRAAAVAAVRSERGACAASIAPLVPFEYTKSAPLYRSTLQVDGHDTEILVKDLSRLALLPGARKVKPDFFHDPRREIAMYRHVLGAAEGTAAYHGHHVDHGTGTVILVIEHVPGLELCDVGSVDIWTDTARWLGRFHVTASATETSVVPLRIHDHDLYRKWSDRAVSASRRLARDEHDALRRLIDVYDRHVVDRLASATRTVIHGEMYPSNVIIGGANADGTFDADGLRVCAVDWESAASGPALLDLAALTTGDWSSADRERMITAYRDAAAAGGFRWEQFDHDLAACSLQLAIQWLGWFVDHDPPPWQRRNWIEEAESAAERLA